MIDHVRLTEILIQYKQDFASSWWKGEKYKWEAVKCFQDNWDIDAADFGEMFERATVKADNLLLSQNVYPVGMICEFARADATATRGMFQMLFDESLDLEERITAFMKRAEELRQQYGNGGWKSHYQNTNYVSTYLWLMFPDKYYKYQYKVFRECAKELDDSYRPKKNGEVKNVIDGYRMYDEIRAVLSADSDIRTMLDAVLTDDCYSDPELITLTMDVGFYIAQNNSSETEQSSEWFPAPEVYTPGFTVEQWSAMLKDPELFDQNSLDVINSFYDIGGEATCKELAEKYGKESHFYSLAMIRLARKIHKATNCPLVPNEQNDNAVWWPIIFIGKNADKKRSGIYVWKLRDELRQALEQREGAAVNPVVNSWLLAWNPNNYDWGNMTDEHSFDTMLQSVRSGGAYFDSWRCNVTKVKPGDRIYIMRLGDRVTPKGIIAAGYAVSESGISEDGARRVDIILTQAFDYRNESIIQQETLKQLFPSQDWSPQASGISIKPDAARWLIDFFDNMQRAGQTIVADTVGLTINPAEHHDPYTETEFLRDVYMSQNQYQELRALLLNKRNVLLQGAPGVGKTFAAKRLAWSILGEKDDSRIEFIQFHQCYSYEEFIEGYRPTESGGFKLQRGIFYRFCEEAKKHSDKKYFFIIDEINRGNLSKIFGELLMLIENDYRKETAVLAYSGEPFSVPENVYIIGMMNTADRSLALIDYALRRRFNFFDMQPGFDSDGFKKYTEALNNELFEALIMQIKQLNQKIKGDSSLGDGFMIGHSYFCNLTAETCTKERLQSIVKYDIIPILKEYWFDEKETADKIAEDLLGTVK